MKDSSWFTKIAAVFTAIGTLIGLVASVTSKKEEKDTIKELNKRIDELERTQKAIETTATEK